MQLQTILEKFWKPTKTTPTTKKPKEKTANNKQTTNNAQHTTKRLKPNTTRFFHALTNNPNKHTPTKPLL